MKSHHITTLAASLSICLFNSSCLEEDDSNFESATESTGVESDNDLRTYEGWLGSALGAPLITGTTTGKSTDFDPECVGGNGRDVSYTWTAPSTGSYNFTTDGSSFDTVLHIRSYADSGQTLGCNDNWLVGESSSVVLELAQGTTVIIVVDGASKAAAGEFALNIHELCAQGCNEPPWQCAVQTGQCQVGPGNPAGVCHYPPVPEGTICEDGLDCTSGSACSGYSCVGYGACFAPPSDCYEPVGQCDYDGSCMYALRPDGAPCDDAIDCTAGDTCDGAGACIGGGDTCAKGQTCTPMGCEGSSPCSQYGDYQDCGSGACCEWDSGCSVCVS